MLTFLRGSSAQKLQEEEGKGIYCLSRKTFVCSWLATSHSNTNQLPLTKERGVQTHQCLNVSVMLESIFPSKGRARIIVVWSVKESTSLQRKQILTTLLQDTRQLSSAASAMFTCALEKEDQIASMTTILKKTLLARDNKWEALHQ